MNPEFRRYLWLELTAQRLVVMPIVSGALLWLVHLIGGGGDFLATTALSMFGALALLWGTRVVADSVSSEIVARTWDGQRMSSLGPWGMAWAKLFGSAVYVWYGCAILGAAYVGLRVLDGLALDHTVLRLTLVTAAVVIAHATSLLASLHAVRRRSGERSTRGAGLFSLGLLAAAPFLLVGNGAAAARETVDWYGLTQDAFVFSVLTAVAYAIWAVVGVYMLMRLELQRRSPPWVWLGFVAFTAAWFAGFADADAVHLGGPGVRHRDLTASRLLVALLACAALYYATLLSEPKDPVEFRRFGREVAAGRLVRAAELIPRWLLTLAVSCVLCVALVLAVAAATRGGGETVGVAGLVTAIVAFMARDAALFAALNLSPRPRRADAAGFVYLVVLYGLAPSLLDALDLDQARPLLLPSWDGGIAAAAPAVVQAAAAIAWASVRWRAYRRRTGGG